MEVCPRCSERARGGQEWFTWLQGHYRFDVTRAQGIVLGRGPVPLGQPFLRNALKGAALVPGHEQHVACFVPGVVGTVRLRPDAEPALVLIDGHHRAARALATRQRFTARVLTEEETVRCTVFGPADVRRALRRRERRGVAK